MKKSLFLAVFFGLFCVSSIMAFDATVTSVTGKAEYSTGGSWNALTEGTKLSKGAVIQTGCKSEVVLTAGSTTLNISPLSRISIEKLTEKKTGENTVSESSSFKLESGSLRSKTRHTDTRKVGHTVTGAVATASVRGTEYTIANNYRRTSVKTHEGRVAVWKNKRPKKAKAAVIEKPVEQGESVENPEDTITESQPGTAGTEQPETGNGEGDSQDNVGSSNGSEASDIAPQAPQGAGTITKGQRSSFGSDGSSKDAHSSAQDRKKFNTTTGTSGSSENKGPAMSSISVNLEW